ncbi:hypothetical protein D9M71_427900 [compost metagenome]
MLRKPGIGIEVDIAVGDRQVGNRSLYLTYFVDLITELFQADGDDLILENLFIERNAHGRNSTPLARQVGTHDAVRQSSCANCRNQEQALLQTQC